MVVTASRNRFFRWIAAVLITYRLVIDSIESFEITFIICPLFPGFEREQESVSMVLAEIVHTVSE